jgi:8-oxo-dGTP pyrophosphatase MutT (NUDIX family)
VPGGRIDTAHEDIEAAARRELLEETGYVPASAHIWFTVSPYAKNVSKDTIYIMRGCTKMHDIHTDPGEKIELEELDFDAFCEFVLRDDFRTKTISLRVAKMLAQGKKEELRMLLLG